MKSKAENHYYRLPVLDGLELLDARRHRQDFPFHTHDTFNITLIREQRFTTRLSNRVLETTKGSILITHPQEVHATLCDNEAGSSFFTFYVSPDVLHSLNGQQPVYFDNGVIEDAALFAAFDSIAGRAQHLQMANQLLAILKQLLQRRASLPAVHPEQARLFQRFIQEEPVEKFSLEQVAGRFGLDKFKFLRLFKQQTGLTPNNYIILRRVEKAKALLRQQADLLAVAVQSGFYDATHLCRHFKRITGVTPMAYRQAVMCNIVP
ncbi:MAG: AraC family transcriptional regulator [Ferruginibacter sp.]